MSTHTYSASWISLSGCQPNRVQLTKSIIANDTLNAATFQIGSEGLNKPRVFHLKIGYPSIDPVDHFVPPFGIGLHECQLLS
jgi:hypothetical protein